MKNLNEFMNDAAFLISRVSMPQVEDGPRFRSWLESMGVDFYETIVDPSGLRPTQTDFDEEKVRSIVSSMKPPTIEELPPIIVSNDGFVVDGHHRYLAAEKEGININALVINLPINKLLSLLLTSAYE